MLDYSVVFVSVMDGIRAIFYGEETEQFPPKEANKLTEEELFDAYTKKLQFNIMGESVFIAALVLYSGYKSWRNQVCCCKKSNCCSNTPDDYVSTRRSQTTGWGWLFILPFCLSALAIAFAALELVNLNCERSTTEYEDCEPFNVWNASDISNKLITASVFVTRLIIPYLVHKNSKAHQDQSTSNETRRSHTRASLSLFHNIVHNSSLDPDFSFRPYEMHKAIEATREACCTLENANHYLLQRPNNSNHSILLTPPVICRRPIVLGIAKTLIPSDETAKHAHTGEGLTAFINKQTTQHLSRDVFDEIAHELKKPQDHTYEIFSPLYGVTQTTPWSILQITINQTQNISTSHFDITIKIHNPLIHNGLNPSITSKVYSNIAKAIIERLTLQTDDQLPILLPETIKQHVHFKNRFGGTLPYTKGSSNIALKLKNITPNSFPRPINHCRLNVSQKAHMDMAMLNDLEHLIKGENLTNKVLNNEALAEQRQLIAHRLVTFFPHDEETKRIIERMRLPESEARISVTTL